MQELIILNEPNTTMLILLYIGCLSILPLLYWGNWMGEGYDDDYVWKDGRWQLQEPEPEPTMCVFYSPGMKEVIDKTLKPIIEPIEIDTKLIEIDK